jgi:hypothetical protein
MLKTLSVKPARAPESACRNGAPDDLREPPAPEEDPAQIVRTRTSVGAARQRRSSPRLASNLGQPVGVLSWERDFLLALAVDVLEDFVGNTNEEDE